MKRLNPTVEIDEDVMDIPTMEAMGTLGYSDYIGHYIFFVDHHDILRATQGGYPIATTSDQVSELIEYLSIVRDQMKDAGK